MCCSDHFNKNSWCHCPEWIVQDPTDDKSTLVQVMAWCLQATSHYLNQCWLRSMMPYSIIRSQWVKQTINTNIISERSVPSRVDIHQLKSERCELLILFELSLMQQGHNFVEHISWKTMRQPFWLFHRKILIMIHKKKHSVTVDTWPSTFSVDYSRQ